MHLKAVCHYRIEKKKIELLIKEQKKKFLLACVACDIVSRPNFAFAQLRSL